MPQSPALHVEHEKLHNQLQELAGLRQELQVLYEKTHAELQASRSEAALERGLREAATADNAALRRWNTQLGEELSALLAHLQDEEDDAALDSGSAAAAVAASSQLSGSAFDGGGGGVSIDGSEASGLSRANAEVLARLVRLRHGGTRHEQQVSQRLLARLMASGEPMLQHEVERLTREQEALPRPPAAAAETAAAAASAASTAAGSPSLHGGGGGAPRGVRAIDGTPAADLAAAQQLELELAAATVRNTSVHARLRRTQEDLRAAVHRSSELHAGSEQLLADLTQATQRIAALEERCVAMDEEQRRRDGTARQLLERRVQQSAEMEAALQARAPPAPPSGLPPLSPPLPLPPSPLSSCLRFLVPHGRRPHPLRRRRCSRPTAARSSTRMCSCGSSRSAAASRTTTWRARAASCRPPPAPRRGSAPMAPRTRAASAPPWPAAWAAAAQRPSRCSRARPSRSGCAPCSGSSPTSASRRLSRRGE